MTVWLDMSTAPKDGTLVDLVFDGIRRTDCHWSDGNQCWCRKHGYPSSTTVFIHPPTGWLPRPENLVMPYEHNAHGHKYIP